VTETAKPEPTDVAPPAAAAAPNGAPASGEAGPTLADLAADLHGRRDRALGMGGPERIASQHEKGKLTARERIDLLFDPDTFVEMGLLATGQSMKGESYDPAKTAADGVVCGHGRIEGREVYVAAYDFTVMAGSMGMIGERKVGRMRELALRNRRPMVWLLDSAGARIQDAAGSTFAETGFLFWDQVNMSGVVPQVAAMLGPCAAGTAYIPGLSDFVPMVKGTSSMSLGGARLVKAATGEDVTDHEMGGSHVHCYESGVGDLEVEDDAGCIAAVREFLSYLPSSNREQPPRHDVVDPVDRRVEGLEKLVPTNMRQAYDMRRVIRKLADDGHVFEVKPTWARNIITAFVRLGGEPVGVVANQPMVKAGALDNDSADKAARFIRMCDAFNVPLLFLQDVPGFIVGREVEKQGIIRHGAKMLYAVSEATVPKITVIVRKAYGAGYYVMCGKGYQPDLIVAWPTAEISVMGPEGAVNIIFNKQVESAPDPDAARRMFTDAIRQQINPYIAASWGMIDDVVDPADTRRVVIEGLRIAASKQVERPWRKHGNIPV
jgi:acetyl-CoA carboxylase carboxyltransferase component